MPIFQYSSEGESNLHWRETPREGGWRRAFRAPGINFPFPFPFIHSVGTGVNYCDMRNGLPSSHASARVSGKRIVHL